MKSLDKYWYDSNLIASLLLPVSWLYCFIVRFRKKLYQLKLKKSYSARKPLVVVGNIAVGGSGKTPLLIALCDYLQTKGYHPGVVSRGYGGNVTGIKQVTMMDSAELVGDEPLMIHQRTNVPVVVGRDRVAAVNKLLSNNTCDVVLSDDGLQHYRMARSLEICVVDSIRGHGNNNCLPAGPLREPLSRLDEVDIIVYSGVNEAKPDQASYHLEIVSLCGLNNEVQKKVTAFAGETVHAVAGIGHPARFFQQLREYGLTIIEHVFADHYAYQESDFSGWENDCIIMTEKDAVKCKDFALADAWFVKVKASFSESLEQELAAKLLPLLQE